MLSAQMFFILADPKWSGEKAKVEEEDLNVFRIGTYTKLSRIENRDRS